MCTLTSCSKPKPKDKTSAKASPKETAAPPKDMNMVRTAGAGGVSEEVSDKGGVLYAKKENSDCCRDCETVFAIGNTSVKALVKLGRYVF